MPSEYQKWIARNEKPAEKVELTPAEKRKNWFDYHKWHVVAVVAAVVLIISLIANSISQRRNGPDLQIAYIGTQYLPEKTVVAMEKALAAYGQDITGNGEVRVYIKQYILEDDPTTYTLLEADLVTGESRFFLMEDPKAFQTAYEPLGYGDGVFAAEAQRQEPLWYGWSDCPVLTELDLDAESQALLAKLSLGRRGIEKGYEHGDMDNRIWKEWTADAGKEE